MRLRAALQLLTVILSCCSFALAQAGPQPPAECAKYAVVPLPAEAQSVVAPTASPACASYKSYRGIGRPVNYAAARACAWQERLAQKAGYSQNPKEPTAWVVGGSLILADIYANGAGVERNWPLAMRFACESEAQTAELALPEMKKLEATPDASKRFELCSYAATTFSENFCMGYENEKAADDREGYYSSLKRSMTPEQQTAFSVLLAAKNAYIVAHADEVDQGGTIRTIRTMGSQNILEELFRVELVHFERKTWPALSKRQIASADGVLQRQYAKTLQQLKERPHQDGDGGVTAQQLEGVEAVWNTYRDAWVAFARARYPDAVDAIRAQIVLDRYRWLRTM
ncbi:MAG: hypothetical protein V4734_05985 [Terriglobus sp.]